jgi:hypothetical protein
LGKVASRTWTVDGQSGVDGQFVGMVESSRNTLLMASHSQACSASTKLCRQLAEPLEPKIQGFCYGHTQNWCSFRGTGKIFAWINHSKRDGWAKIWYLGATEHFPGLTIEPRKSDTEGHWGNFSGSFKIYNDKDVQAALAMLSSISHPLSL